MKKFWQKFNKKTEINLFFIFLILLTSFINLRYFFQSGIFHAHDLENHLARIANYYLALKDQHFPVRWARNLNHKFGYPVFNYLYPLANILAYPLIVFNFGIENSLKIILFSAYFFSGLFFYLWLKKHFKSFPAFCGAIFYISAPYQFLDIYVRGIVGETLAFALLPAVLYFLALFFEKKTSINFLFLIFSTAIFALSHNLMVMVFTPLILLYWFYLSYTQKKFLNLTLVALLLGYALTGFFWIPAFWEKNFITLEAFNSQTFYQDHFVYWWQLLHPKWEFGFSVKGDGDTMSFQLGLAHLFLVVLFLWEIITWKFKQKEREYKFFFFAAFFLLVMSIFLMLPLSKKIWQTIPFIGLLQFPWRLLAVSTFSLALLAAVLSLSYKRIIFILAIFSLIYCQRFVKPFRWEKKSDQYYYDFLFTTSTLHEHKPKWFEEEKALNLKNKFISDSGLVVFRELEWKTAKHQYEIDVPQTTKVWEKTAYFPGWQVYIDGKKIPILFSHPQYSGIIGFEAPSGRHQVLVKFTEMTKARIIGDLISISAVLASGYFILKLRKNGF